MEKVRLNWSDLILEHTDANEDSVGINVSTTISPRRCPA